MNQLKIIGAENLWTGRLHLASELTHEEAQRAVNNLGAEARISIVGYLAVGSPAFTMLRWPENREDYVEALSDPQCEFALHALAKSLKANAIEQDIVPRNRIHCMMGRLVDGYDGSEVAPLKDCQRNLSGFRATAGHMISIRLKKSGTLIPYGEAVAIIEANRQDEYAVHEIGEQLKQHHYAIEHGPSESGPGYVHLYETHWASGATP